MKGKKAGDTPVPMPLSTRLQAKQLEQLGADPDEGSGTYGHRHSDQQKAKVQGVRGKTGTAKAARVTKSTKHTKGNGKKEASEEEAKLPSENARATSGNSVAVKSQRKNPPTDSNSSNRSQRGKTAATQKRRGGRIEVPAEQEDSDSPGEAEELPQPTKRAKKRDLKEAVSEVDVAASSAAEKGSALEEGHKRAAEDSDHSLVVAAVDGTGATNTRIIEEQKKQVDADSTGAEDPHLPAKGSSLAMRKKANAKSNNVRRSSRKALTVEDVFGASDGSSQTDEGLNGAEESEDTEDEKQSPSSKKRKAAVEKEDRSSSKNMDKQKIAVARVDKKVSPVKPSRVNSRKRIIVGSEDEDELENLSAKTKSNKTDEEGSLSGSNQKGKAAGKPTAESTSTTLSNVGNRIKKKSILSDPIQGSENIDEMRSTTADATSTLTPASTKSVLSTITIRTEAVSSSKILAERGLYSSERSQSSSTELVPISTGVKMIPRTSNSHARKANAEELRKQRQEWTADIRTFIENSQVLSDTFGTSSDPLLLFETADDVRKLMVNNSHWSSFLVNADKAVLDSFSDHQDENILKKNTKRRSEVSINNSRANSIDKYFSMEPPKGVPSAQIDGTYSTINDTDDPYGVYDEKGRLEDSEMSARDRSFLLRTSADLNMMTDNLHELLQIMGENRDKRELPTTAEAINYALDHQHAWGIREVPELVELISERINSRLARKDLKEVANIPSSSREVQSEEHKAAGRITRFGGKVDNGSSSSLNSTDISKFARSTSSLSPNIHEQLVVKAPVAAAPLPPAALPLQHVPSKPPQPPRPPHWSNPNLAAPPVQQHMQEALKSAHLSSSGAMTDNSFSMTHKDSTDAHGLAHRHDRDMKFQQQQKSTNILINQSPIQAHKANGDNSLPHPLADNSITGFRIEARKEGDINSTRTPNRSPIDKAGSSVDIDHSKESTSVSSKDQSRGNAFVLDHKSADTEHKICTSNESAESIRDVEKNRSPDSERKSKKAKKHKKEKKDSKKHSKSKKHSRDSYESHDSRKRRRSDEHGSEDRHHRDEKRRRSSPRDGASSHSNSRKYRSQSRSPSRTNYIDRKSSEKEGKNDTDRGSATSFQPEAQNEDQEITYSSNSNSGRDHRRDSRSQPRTSGSDIGIVQHTVSSSYNSYSSRNSGDLGFNYHYSRSGDSDYGNRNFNNGSGRGMYRRNESSYTGKYNNQRFQDRGGNGERNDGGPYKNGGNHNYNYRNNQNSSSYGSQNRNYY